MIVRKRDGRLEEFDSGKILESIKQAALAVEGKDADILHRAAEIQRITRELIDVGFDPEDAQANAESQYEGYIENGIYTEYDEEEAQEVLDIVTEAVDSLGLGEDDIIDTGTIQEFVAKALIELNHAKTATEYIVKSSNRERVREMNTSLMKSFEDLTFGKSSDVETKRENANIDGDSSMGTMLKYGSEGAKKFNLLYVVPPEMSKAHSDGDIHIHDLDFYALTETCVVGDTKLVVYDTEVGVETEITAADLHALLSGNAEVDKVVYQEDKRYKIKSNGEFVDIINTVKHGSIDKKVLHIETRCGYIEVTDDHVVLAEHAGAGYVRHYKAKELYTGDFLIKQNEKPDDREILSITEVDYDGFVFDFETSNHYFDANGFMVHNCCQIDLEKLFKGGFNTGHGFLREPGEIRSYAALACIAIQSNQNDMHKQMVA